MCAFTACVRFLRRRGPAGLRKTIVSPSFVTVHNTAKDREKLPDSHSIIRKLSILGYRLSLFKDFSYITVKEICETAGVNRSTFYLHYETMGDLLAECAAYMNERFLSYMEQDVETFVAKLHDCPMEELYLITPEYLTPYLRYIKENQRLFRTGLENAATLRMEDSYAGLFRHVITPILDRYGVPQQDRPYLMAFYMQGLMAIISEWLKDDCRDSIEHITAVIQKCVTRG